MRKTKKRLVIVVLILLFLGIGFAFLQTDLDLTGTTNIMGNSWNVYLDNIIVTSGSVTGEQVISEPTISGDTISFQVNLDEPGDYYEFTVNAVNAGTLDAMIDTISKTEHLPSYIKYDVTYHDDLSVEERQLLAANTIDVYKVRVEYRADINGNNLPRGNDLNSYNNLDMRFSVVYVQADSTAIPVSTYRRYQGRGSYYVNRYNNQLLNLSHDYLSALSSFEKPIFLEHILDDNDTITDTYYGFILNQRLYFLSINSDNYQKDKYFLDQVFNENSRYYYDLNTDNEQSVYIDCDSHLGFALKKGSLVNVGVIDGNQLQKIYTIEFRIGGGIPTYTYSFGYSGTFYELPESYCS